MTNSSLLNAYWKSILDDYATYVLYFTPHNRLQFKKKKIELSIRFPYIFGSNQLHLIALFVSIQILCYLLPPLRKHWNDWKSFNRINHVIQFHSHNPVCVMCTDWMMTIFWVWIIMWALSILFLDNEFVRFVNIFWLKSTHKHKAPTDR